MPDFSKRSYELEEMDDLTCSGEVVDQALRELEVVNIWLGGNFVTIKGLSELLKNWDNSKKVKMADLGCGGGDMLRLINHWAMRKKLKVSLTGIDANPNIIDYAKANLRNIPEVKFLSLDIFSKEFKEMKFDVVVGTLFFHHFTNEQLIRFFRQLKTQVSTGLIINDIHRHPLAYYSIKFITQWFSRSTMVQSDAPLSVIRAFTKNDLIKILNAAGCENYSIKWRWAFRWQVVVTF